MNAIAKAVRLDGLRMTAGGMLSMLLMAVLIPAFGLPLVVFVLCALALLFKKQVTAIAAWLGAHIFVSTPLTVLIAVAFVAIVVAASLLISPRSYRRKEP
ncbi:hypothetical protein [Bifidobacterium sp.]|jgi:ABC-type amino acid transport system permease subunit|uniref:hypothetical protein n=1 Tax=Bifidobacterium sp. TaxID=41200 RepID=UPI0025C25A07|nr:hypothetical protein [Bifidobacterium sp.]MCH4209226.1 hypothetical protein [Bifidobacterium sp.]MCI1224663.1 hypothetical protein [Bifidobacterium sp.]